MWWQETLETYARRFTDQPPGLRIQGGIGSPVVLGAGSHGVVFACVDPKYVLKLTSDCSEGYFASTYMDQSQRSAGIASYKQIAILRRTPRGSAFAMWREALIAQPLIHRTWFERTYGLVQTTDALRLVLAYGQTSLAFRKLCERNPKLVRGDIDARMMDLAPRVNDTAYEFLADMLTWAGTVVLGDKGRGKGKDKDKLPKPQDAKLPAGDSVIGVRAKLDTNLQMAMLFQALRAGAKAMRETSTILVDVGRALEEEIKNGILLTDVFPRNIGPVSRGKLVVNVVFDPGHAFFLNNRHNENLMRLPRC